MKPRFIPHECESECNCKLCQDYINKLDEYRQSISRGESLESKAYFVLGKHQSKIAKKVKRKFELPKPILARPINMS